VASHSAPTRTFPRLPAWLPPRWVVLTALLVLEILVVSLRFDAGTIPEADAWWLKLLRHGILPRVVIAAVVLLLILGGAQLRQELQRVPAQARRPRHLWLCLAGHLLALTAFVLLTAVVFEGDVQASGQADLAFAAWAAAGLACVVFWAAAVLPLRLWLAFARRRVGLIALAVVVGGATAVAYRFTNLFWRPLGEATLQVVRIWLHLLGWETVSRPDVLSVGTPSFRINIDRDCSGYEGVGLIFIFLCVYLWWFRHTLRLPRALLLVPVGMAVSWLANTWRIAGLIAIGSLGARRLALGGFHSEAGWLAFNAVALGLVAVTQRARFFSRQPSSPAGTRLPNATAAYLGPLLAIVGTAMVTAALSSGFDWLYPLRVAAAGGTLWYFWRRYPRWQWTGPSPAVAVGAAVFVLWIGLDWLLSDDNARTDADGMFAASLKALPSVWLAVWLVCRVVGSVVTVPLAEELAFRGYLPRRLMARDFEAVPLGRFTVLAFVVSSVLFGIVHGRRWLVGTLAGMAYALVLLRRRRLGDAVLAHATTNALLDVYVLTTGAWSLWT